MQSAADGERSEPGEQWATIALETFEHGVVPWAGRPYAQWVRTWSRAHPRDPVGQTQVPEKIYLAFQQRTPGQRLTRQGAERLGYPSDPG